MTRDAPLAGRGALASCAAIAIYMVVAMAVGSRSAKAARLCPMYRLSGRSCPLCGLTRSLGLIGRGRVREALAGYPLALASAAALALFAIVRTAGRTRHV